MVSDMQSTAARAQLAELLKTKKMVLINFWYTSCSWCVTEFPYMQESYDMYSEDVALIALDPLEQNDALTTTTRERVATIVRLIDPAITIHDFRMVSGPTHTNVIFDAVVPHSVPLSDKEVTRRIIEGVRALDGNYFAVVNIDKSFV